MPQRPTLSQGGLSIRLERVRPVSRIGTDPVTVVYTGWSHSTLKAGAMAGEWTFQSFTYGRLPVVIDSATRFPVGLQLVFSTKTDGMNGSDGLAETTPPASPSH